MAYNKECLIVILDVRRSASEEFKLKSVKCAAEILKDKICSAKKDFISFVLVGCERTQNECNTNVSHDEYLNIVEYEHTQIATWQLLLNFFKFVNEEPSEKGEWLEALVVAMGKLKSAQDTFKFARERIVLFYDFNATSQDYDSFDVITKSILTTEIDLIVATHNIAYIDNTVTNQPQAIFQSSRKASAEELENQKYALQLVSNCNATICNFKEVLHTVFKVQNKHPWTWHAKLSIGSKIDINVSGIIAIKDESHIKLKKCWGEANEVVTREVHHLIKGNEVSVEPEEMIDGYMLGGTPVAYDKALFDEDVNYTPGLKFVGFVKRCDIPDEYFCGDSLYMIVHRKGMNASARKLDALVRALHNTSRAILCWKIYSAKFNQPKIVVLLPNAIQDERPATLSMVELSYQSQHHFWDFPALRTAKTECSEEQLGAIDKLIDSMDLELTLKDGQQPRQTRQNDLLPFDQLPHIYEQNVMDVLERKVLCNAEDEQFIEMLNDKNFVEVFWKLPEPIEQKAKQAASQVKKLFPFEFSTGWLEKLKAQPPLPQIKKEPNGVTDSKGELDFDRVGLSTPAVDFEQLLRHHVLDVQHKTQRDAKFNEYARQMRDVIDQLLREKPLDLEKLLAAFKVYRSRIYDFAAFGDYNHWLVKVKAYVIAHKLQKFWSDVMVKHNLGICLVGETSIEDEMRIVDYYEVQKWPEHSASGTSIEDAMDDDMDELLASF